MSVCEVLIRQPAGDSSPTHTQSAWPRLRAPEARLHMTWRCTTSYWHAPSALILCPVPHTHALLFCVTVEWQLYPIISRCMSAQLFFNTTISNHILQTYNVCYRAWWLKKHLKLQTPGPVLYIYINCTINWGIWVCSILLYYLKYNLV